MDVASDIAGRQNLTTNSPAPLALAICLLSFLQGFLNVRCRGIFEMYPLELDFTTLHFDQVFFFLWSLLQREERSFFWMRGDYMHLRL